MQKNAGIALSSGLQGCGGGCVIAIGLGLVCSTAYGVNYTTRVNAQDLLDGDTIVQTDTLAAAWDSDVAVPGQTWTAAGNNVIDKTYSATGTGVGIRAWQGSTLRATGMTVEMRSRSTIGAVAGYEVVTGGGITPGPNDLIGTLFLDRSTINTYANFSAGVVGVGPQSSVTVTNSTIHTRGSSSSITTYKSSAGAFFLAGSNGTLTDSTIVTEGIQSTGVAVRAVGESARATATLRNVDITTNGSQARGVHVVTANTATGSTELDNVTINTHGSEAPGIETSEYSNVRITGAGVDVTTTGQNSPGLRLFGWNLMDATGTVVSRTSDSGSPAILISMPASFTGSGNKATTEGDDSSAVQSVSETSTASDFTANTSGARSHAFEAAGVTITGVYFKGDLTVNGSNGHTTGAGAYGAYAYNGGTLTISGGSSTTTTGAGSHGLVVTGTAPDRLGTLVLDGASATVHSDDAVGAAVSDFGTLTTKSSASIETFGANGHALQVTRGSGIRGAAVLTDTTLTTHGSNAYGALIEGGAVTLGSGLAIETYGQGSSGIVMATLPDPADATVFDSNLSVHTRGQDAHAFSLRNGIVYELHPDFSADKMQVEGADSAILQAQDPGTTLTLSAAQSLAGAQVAAGAYGARAEPGATIVFGGTSAGGGAPLQAAGGTLRFQDGSTAAGSRIQVEPGGVVDLSAHAGTLAAGSISGDNGASIVLGPNTLETGGDNTSSRYAGTIEGNGGLSKVGTGTLTLAGLPPFGYQGATEVKQGVLRLTDIADPPNFVHTFTLDGGWLDLSHGGDPNANPQNEWAGLTFITPNPTAGGGVIGSSDQVDFAPAAGTTQVFTDQIGGATPATQGVYVVQEGEGTLELTGTNTYVGNTRVLAGTLRVTRDENLGNPDLAREVILNGGDLEIGGNVGAGRRLLELRQSATVRVDAGATGSWAGAVNLNDCDCVLTKDGAGTLALGAETALPSLHMLAGDVTVEGGDLGGAPVAITADGGAVSSVVLNRTRLAGSPTIFQVSAGSDASLTANGTLLSGAVRAEGAGSRGVLTLGAGTQYTGVATQSTGGQLDVRLADGSATWTVPGNALVQNLHNDGLITFAQPAPDYRTIDVAGGYSGSGIVTLNTVLNEGGPLSNQQTDRLLIHGDVAPGTATSVQLNTTGSGANSNIGNDHKFYATQGISLVQVAGNSTLDAFQLNQRGRNYVAAAGSPYQYRLFGYGPGSPYGTADPQQGVIPGATPLWDYRLQTAYETKGGEVIPGVPDNNRPPVGPPVDPEPGPPVRPALLPQASSYIIAPLAFQRYGEFVAGTLQRRLGELRELDTQQPARRFESFARVIGDRSNYRSNRAWEQYGYDYSQTSEALQLGGNYLTGISPTQQLRVGGAVTVGSMKADPKGGNQDSRLKADAQTLSLIGTWRHVEGWYADGVLSGSHYSGSVHASGRRAADVKARSVEASLEVGRRLVLRSGVEVTPNLQLLGQRLYTDDPDDRDDLDVKLGTQKRITARAGVRVGVPIKGTVSWTPYLAAGLSQSWGGTQEVRVAKGTSIAPGQTGKSVYMGLGATGMVSPALSVYGEITREQRVGGYGYSGTTGTVGIRYMF